MINFDVSEIDLCGNTVYHIHYCTHTHHILKVETQTFNNTDIINTCMKFVQL